MKYDFDTVTDRRGTSSSKWDVAEGELPMTIADMDFATCPEIVAALRERLDRGIFGYTDVPERWREAAVSWWDRRYGLKMDGEDYSSFVSMFDMALNFKEDGTGTLTSEGEDIPLKWDSNSFTDGADTFQYSFDADGNLTFEAEGTLFIFSRA